MDIIGFFGGRVTLRCEERCATALLNLLMEKEIGYENFSVCDGGIRLTLSERSAKNIKDACEARGICLSVVERRGLPRLFFRYGKRVGLMAGAFFVTFILWLSSRVVWNVQITGNSSLGEREIEYMLAESGLAAGTYLPDLDTDLVETRLLLTHSEISWISINIKGTTANVEILETVRGEEESRAAANLVAARDGQIERIEAYDGNVCVKVGDVVHMGDVLVSGVYDSNAGSLRTARAKGKIYARTVREFYVEIPLETTQKVYTGREWSEKYINFFSKRIKVFANTGNEGATCDIIYYNSMMGIPGGAAIPVGIETVKHLEYREEPVTLDDETAMTRAFDELETQLGTFVSETGAELLSKTIEYELDETAYRLRCTVVCIENIALTQEFDVN